MSFLEKNHGIWILSYSATPSKYQPKAVKARTPLPDKVAKELKRLRKCTSPKAVLQDSKHLSHNRTRGMRNYQKPLAAMSSRSRAPIVVGLAQLPTSRQYRPGNGNHIRREQGLFGTFMCHPFVPAMCFISDQLFGNNAPQQLAKPRDPNRSCKLFGSKTKKYLNSLESLAKRAEETYSKLTTAITAFVKEVLDKPVKLKLKHAKKVHEKVRSKHLPHLPALSPPGLVTAAD
jgi:hypothetical protein